MQQNVSKNKQVLRKDIKRFKYQPEKTALSEQEGAEHPQLNNRAGQSEDVTQLPATPPQHSLLHMRPLHGMS